MIADTNSGLPHMLPSEAAFAAAVDALGITNDSQVRTAGPPTIDCWGSVRSCLPCLVLTCMLPPVGDTLDQSCVCGLCLHISP